LVIAKTRTSARLVFSLSMSGGNYPDLLTRLVRTNDDVAAVAVAFQQSLSR
jgi:hypothetical protein